MWHNLSKNNPNPNLTLLTFMESRKKKFSLKNVLNGLGPQEEDPVLNPALENALLANPLCPRKEKKRSGCYIIILVLIYLPHPQPAYDALLKMK